MDGIFSCVYMFRTLCPMIPQLIHVLLLMCCRIKSILVVNPRLKGRSSFNDSISCDISDSPSGYPSSLIGHICHQIGWFEAFIGSGDNDLGPFVIQLNQQCRG
jgi:hypothetical protein